jgi:23S rRNA (adenine2030-N6)-methyltransferase
LVSYRHTFHAGSHADVLKHIILIALARYLTEKPAAVLCVDTHAGAGLYRLDGDHAVTSGEAASGVLQLIQKKDQLFLGKGRPVSSAAQPVAESRPADDPLIADYLQVIRTFNGGSELRVYPGSPLLMHEVFRPTDPLRLFELHPTDSRSLFGHIGQLNTGRRVQIHRTDGFESLKPMLPPPSRRALVLMDPSYELKSDYGRVQEAIDHALTRFPSGCYVVWYPIIARHEAHDLPRRLRTIANRHHRPWMNATLSVGKRDSDTRPGLTGSGMMVINPPFTLRKALENTLPLLVSTLGLGRGEGFTVESGTGH